MCFKLKRISQKYIIALLNCLESLQFYLSLDSARDLLFCFMLCRSMNRQLEHQRIDSCATAVIPLGRALLTALIIQLN